MEPMSLSSQLRDRTSPASLFFEERFPRLRAAQQDVVARASGIEILLPDTEDGYPWGSVGTAVDYRVRFAFPQSVAYADRWDFMAPEGFSLLVDRARELLPPLPAEEGACSQRLSGWAGPFFESLRDLLRATGGQAVLSPELEWGLASHCYVLGLYDAVHRAGTAMPSPLYDVPAMAGVAAISRLCPNGTIADIVAMSHLFHRTQSELLTAGRVVLGHGLVGGRSVGGAGFDLIADGCLIDVKAAKDLRNLTKSAWAWQLLGYALLDLNDALAIRSVGLYLARQGVFVEWSVDDFCGLLGACRPRSLASLRNDFQLALKRPDGHETSSTATPIRGSEEI
jgi:hypothetical protein